MSESSKYLDLTTPYLKGNGIDCGSGGWPVVPWAIQVELPPNQFRQYTGRELPETVEWRGDIFDLPFRDGTLDFVYSSHLIEDFNRERYWQPLFTEWARVLKPGGYLVILVPDFKLWHAALKRGQPPNCSHWAPEPSVGDLTAYMSSVGLQVIRDSLTAKSAEDYSILGVGQKT